MATGEQRIQCRSCREEISLESDSCPHCGTALRSRLRSVAAIGFGLVVCVASATNLSALWFYGAAGGAVALAGVVFLYDRRQRLVGESV